MCRTVTVVHVGKSARFCAECSVSLADTRSYFRPMKGLYPEPRVLACSGLCLRKWMAANPQKRKGRPATTPSPRPGTNKLSLSH